MVDKGDQTGLSGGEQQPLEKAEHTSDSDSVQGQRASNPGDTKKKPPTSGNPDNRTVSANTAGFDVKTYKPKSTLTNEMLAFDKSLNSLLSWKEELKLLTLDANINHSYYDAWVGEANKIFIRCVSLRKRLKKYANKGG